MNNFRSNRGYKGCNRQEYRRLRNEHLCRIRFVKPDSWRNFLPVRMLMSGILCTNGLKKIFLIIGYRASILREDGTLAVTIQENTAMLLKGLIPREYPSYFRFSNGMWQERSEVSV